MELLELEPAPLFHPIPKSSGTPVQTYHIWRKWNARVHGSILHSGTSLLTIPEKLVRNTIEHRVYDIGGKIGSIVLFQSGSQHAILNLVLTQRIGKVTYRQCCGATRLAI